MKIESLSMRFHNWEAFLSTKLFMKRESRYYFNLVYTYFRWVDDYVDDENRKEIERTQFLSRQQTLLKRLYQGYKFRPENYLEWAITKVIEYDLEHNSQLKSAIFRMFQVFEFDTIRKNKVPSFKELKRYSVNLGSAYARSLLYFIAPEYGRYREVYSLLAYTCHLVHLLRDFAEDKEIGYINISKEEMEQYNIRLEQIHDENFSHWLNEKIRIIRSLFKKGKCELEKIPILCVKLIGYLYCFRYERILSQIEEDGYKLKDKYPMRWRDLAQLISIFIYTPLRHLCCIIKR
ncbi:squalene/phytoene synthase family protein [candidate division WOR-3 bacterium]|nr:squalene/phytoene synthase family protein [candidate division WOR-3 bacterium]